MTPKKFLYTILTIIAIIIIGNLIKTPPEEQQKLPSKTEPFDWQAAIRVRSDLNLSEQEDTFTFAQIEQMYEKFKNFIGPQNLKLVEYSGSDNADVNDAVWIGFTVILTDKGKDKLPDSPQTHRQFNEQTEYYINYNTAAYIGEDKTPESEDSQDTDEKSNDIEKPQDIDKKSDDTEKPQKAEKTQDNEQTDQNSLYYCENGDDCTMVKADCCGCENGGKSTSINRSHLENWNQTKQQECKDMVCAAVFTCAPGIHSECINNKCTLIDGAEQ